MQEVYVVYGRTRVEYFDEEEATQIFGVYKSFELALNAFKEKINKCRDNFMWLPISEQCESELMSADLFSDFQLDDEECDAPEYDNIRVTSLGWSYEFNEEEDGEPGYGLWEMVMYDGTDSAMELRFPRVVLECCSVKS